MLKFHISNVPWKLIALEAKGNAKNPNDITEWMSGVSSRWNELIPSIEHRSMKFNFTEYIFAPHIWLNGAHIGAKWAEKRYVFAALNLTRIAVELCAFFPSFVNINEFRWLLLPQIVCRVQTLLPQAIRGWNNDVSCFGQKIIVFFSFLHGTIHKMSCRV